MIDIVEKQEFLEFKKYLVISYRYRIFDYLVSDKYGNLFILEHCPEKRTIPFKKLNVFENRGIKTIKYHQSNVSFKKLKKLAYKVNELLFISNLNLF
jgi:hypothetical protein